MKRINKFLTSLMSFSAVMFTAGAAMAAEGTGIAGHGDAGWLAAAIGVGMGLAAFGGAFGQSRAAAAALEGISRNPNASDKVFVPMILGLAFIESLVLFTWVLMLMMVLKL